jgi:hypothetical protein
MISSGKDVRCGERNVSNPAVETAGYKMIDALKQ